MKKLTLLLILLIFCGAALSPAPSMAAGKSEAAKSAFVVKGRVGGSTADIKQVRVTPNFSLFQIVKSFIASRLHRETMINDQPSPPDQPQKGSGPRWYQEYISIKDSGWDVGSK